MVCAFFGHRDAPESIKLQLRQCITKLIENENVNTFYVGDKGNFDYMVFQELKRLKELYTHINYTVVLSKLPDKKDSTFYGSEKNTMFPESLEHTPPRFAISKRNSWLVDNADIFITYVIHSWGGAAQYKELAQKRGKCVINLE